MIGRKEQLKEIGKAVVEVEVDFSFSEGVVIKGKS